LREIAPDFEGELMKKPYSKPALLKRTLLSNVTAEPPPSNGKAVD
jgi:hypothetical protein